MSAWKSRHHPVSALLAIALVAAGLAGCGGEGEPSAGTSPPETPRNLAGEWRAVLASPGGELPFILLLEGEPGAYRASVVNGEERLPFSDVRQAGDELTLAFSWYDAEITATVSPDGSVLRGRWRKTAAKGVDSSLPFSATRGVATRFLRSTATPVAGAPESVDGVWEAAFVDEDGTTVARAEFRQNGDHVAGTFLTPTGDYRFLEGSYEQGQLRLSTFDGAHAFLFTATADAEGSLSGDFWSRDSYHATWTARPVDAEAEVLPDSWAQVEVTAEDGVINFAFEDLAGRTVSLTDPAFAARPVVVNLFGTWCPNCADEAPWLARWHRTFGDSIAFVGLAFEYTGDVTRDREMVERYAERHGIRYPLLLAGTSDKADAAAALGFVDRVFAYPTTLFLDSDHRVVAIHSGFAGPGTGSHHEEMVAELEAALAALRDGRVPGPAD